MFAVVDVTDDGQKAPQASAANPVYYFPFTFGYKEVGPWTPEPQPDQAQVKHTIAKAIAAQGYLFLTKKSPAALLLTFRWGRMAPKTLEPVLDHPDDDMATLVGGVNKGEDVSPLGAHRADFALAASVPRYFLSIEAFDFAAAQKNEKIPLWCARVSVDAAGTTLAGALPGLADAIAPLLGKDLRPQILR